MNALRRKRLLSAVVFGVAMSALPAVGAPYAITYKGVVGDSKFVYFVSGAPYTLTIVFDNGGNTANNQAWEPSALRCMILTNDSGKATFVQNLQLYPPEKVSGKVVTDPQGKLTAVYDIVMDRNVVDGEYSVSNFQTTSQTSFTTPLSWVAESGIPVFFSDSNGASMLDKAGGVIMKYSSWLDPVPFNTTCDGKPLPTPAVTSVPTLTVWPLWALGALSAGLGLRRLRRKG